jgi:transposase
LSSSRPRFPHVVARASTDIVFRWFLGLSIDDKVPDETTICHFRCTRLGEQQYEEIFNEIVKKCIEKDLVKAKRYIIDSTHVEANTGAPFVKKLISIFHYI